MNDFDYDIMERRRIARQAKYRKCGSRSRKCSLSTDGMTRKEWEKRNGVVMTYKLNRPVSWKEFRSMPRDVQAEYIRGLSDTYGINVSALARMFDMSHEGVRSYLKKNGLSEQLQKSRHMDAEAIDRWEKFVAGELVTPTCVVDEAVPSSEPAAVTERAIIGPVHKHGMDMAKLTLVFEGKIDYNGIVNSLRSIIGDEAEGRITLEYDVLNRM